VNQKDIIDAVFKKGLFSARNLAQELNLNERERTQLKDYFKNDEIKNLPSSF